MPSSTRIVLFLGAPGSGKGTQAARLSAQLGMATLSTGELLRAAVTKSAPKACKLKKILASGALVSDETICSIVAAQLQRGIPRHGLVLDGFPRTQPQAEYLDTLLNTQGAGAPLVIHIQIAPERLVNRLSARRQCSLCGAIFNLESRPSLLGTKCENDGGLLIQREDDRKPVIRRRIAEFESGAAPLIAHYSKGDYWQIDGDRDPECVFEDVLGIVSRRKRLGSAGNDVARSPSTSLNFSVIRPISKASAA